MKQLFTILVTLLFINAYSQPPADVALNFGSAHGFNNTVFAIAVQNGGKLVVGGSFNTYRGVTVNGIIRLNSDGSRDTSFNTGTGFFAARVLAIAIQADGKILAGGRFLSYNRTASNRIIRLNADGTIDPSFITQTGFNDRVSSIAVQGDGKILIGGLFTSYKSTVANRIIRLNNDGSVDSGFATGAGFDSPVTAIVLQNDNKIVIGGTFSSYNGTSGQNRLIRLNADGTRDATFAIGAGFDAAVNTLALQNDGKIVVGGLFTTFNAITGQNRIVRLNTNGTVDNTFVTGTGFNDEVSTIAIQSDGRLLIGGDFTAYNTTTQNRIVRINTDGTPDTSFITGGGFNFHVHVIALYPGGKVAVGGEFVVYNGLFGTKFRIIQLNTNGSSDNTFVTGTGFNGYVETLAVQQDGKLLVGGQFSIFNNTNLSNVARFNTDGTRDTNFMRGSGSGNVNKLVVQSDGKVLVGGVFSNYNGASVRGIVRLNADGTRDFSFIPEPNLYNINAIALQPDGKIIVGGEFSISNGTIQQKNIIRLNADGTKDNSFIAGSGFDGVVATITRQSDGKLLVGGSFTSYDGTAGQNNIIRLNSDGTKDPGFITGTGFNDRVREIVLQDDGKILVAGFFTSYSGTSNQNRLIRLNTYGTRDNSFTTGTGFNGGVASVAIQKDNKIVVGGTFTSYNGTTGLNRLVRLNPNGTLDTSLATGAGFEDTVTTIALKDNGIILVGGRFDLYNNSISSASLIGLLGGFDSTLSIPEATTINKPVFYPNPAKDNVTIALPSYENSKLEIYDLAGRLLYTTIVTENNRSIDVANLLPNIYIFRVSAGSQTTSKKIVKL